MTYSFASFKWQDSVITHALSSKLANYFEAFWKFSNWLWDHWRGTSQSVRIKDCICHSLYSLYMYYFLPWPSLQLNLENNLKMSLLLLIVVILSGVWISKSTWPFSKMLDFALYKRGDGTVRVQVSVVVIWSRLKVIWVSNVNGGQIDADQVKMICSFDGKQTGKCQKVM